MTARPCLTSRSIGRGSRCDARLGLHPADHFGGRWAGVGGWGCDLNTLVGYQIVLAKPIAGFVQGGVRKSGYEGCESDRVLVFVDNIGVRCKDLARQQLGALPTGYLFARNNLGDMKLCVEGDLFAVSQTN